MHNISDILRGWRQSESRPNARHEIRRRRAAGELTKAQFVDIAYEEYAWLRERGADVTASSFAHQFPTHLDSIRRTLEVHDALNSEIGDWPDQGEQFLHYDILAEIGRGAAGRVYLASNLGLNRNEVLKLTRVNGCTEAETMAHLAHKGIVPVHAMMQDHERKLTAIAMPYLGQATLADVIARLFGTRNRESNKDKKPGGSISPTRQPLRANEILAAAADDVQSWTQETLLAGSFHDGAVEISRQLGETLAFSHSNVVHGDIKPSNILITPWGQAMLLDFNLAVRNDSDRDVHGGTLPYMAPELLSDLQEDHERLTSWRRGEATGSFSLPLASVRPTSETDIYSLGVVMYQLFTGVFPFDAFEHVTPKNATYIVRALLENQRTGALPARDRATGVDSEVSQLIERCMAYDPEERPSAAELASSLEAIAKRAALQSREIHQRDFQHELELQSQKAREDAARSVWKWSAMVALTLTMVFSTAAGLMMLPKGRSTSNAAVSLEESFTRIRELLATEDNLDEAIGYVRNMLDHSDDPRLHGIYAHLMFRLDPVRFRNHEEHFRRAAEQGDPRALMNYAVCLQPTNPSKAKSLLLKAIAKQSSLWQAHFQLAKMANSAPNGLVTHAEAADHLIWAMRKMPGRPEHAAHFNSAIVLLKRFDEVDGVEDVLQAAVEAGVNRDQSLEKAIQHAQVEQQPWCQELLAQMPKGSNSTQIQSLVEPIELLIVRPPTTTAPGR